MPWLFKLKHQQDITLLVWFALKILYLKCSNFIYHSIVRFAIETILHYMKTNFCLKDLLQQNK